jgi:DNA invertase Pin-like site-specific DNA recombinase
MPEYSINPADPAYSFTRFSDPVQSKGDSLRRQTAATEEWCKRHGVHLDTTLTLHHVGSAYRGKHRDDKFALGQFLKLAQRGRIPRGSYLIIENLDRLSREDERTALRLWMDILDAGVNIVQLVPETIFRHEKSDMVDIMRAIIELSRGHSESRMKSERLTAAWSERKRRARESGETLTQNLPGWIEIRGGKRCIRPGAKATIKRLFQLAAGGYGETRIRRLFTKEGVPDLGVSGRWTKPYIHALLKDRRLLGEFQPIVLTTGEPDGPVISNYFPVVLTEAEFYAAQRGKDGRRCARKDVGPADLQRIDELHQQGETVAEISRCLGISRQSTYRALIRLGRRKKPTERTAWHVYLFAGGMVRDYHSQRHFNLATWRKGDGYSKALVLDGGQESFPYFVFERAIVHELNEIDPREVLDGANGHDSVVALEGELGSVEARIAELEGELLTGDVKAIGRVLRQLEARQAELSRQLADARQKASNPLSATWGEAKTLLATLDSAADQEDVRVRLRAALRRIIAGVRMAILTGEQQKIALVDIEFMGQHANHFRSYTVWYRRGYGNGAFSRPGSWAVESAAGEGPPIRYEQDGEDMIVHPSDWIQSLPTEPREWHPLPE